MLHYHAEQRRLARNQADIAEAVAFGYAGVKIRDAAHTLQRFLAERRK